MRQWRIHFCDPHGEYRMVSILKRFMAACALVFVSVASYATELNFNMTPGVTPVSKAQYSLHMTMFAVVTIIGILVFAVMIYSLIRHRKSLGVKPAHFHENIQIEVIWTVIPFIILTVLAIPATKALILLHDTSKSELTIAVKGYQWYWHYDYLNEGVSFFSNLSTSDEQVKGLLEKDGNYLLEVDKPLVVPINTKIRFAFTSQDVIHSWWVPALGVKKDTIPGFVNEAWATIEEPGIYRGQCAELCGVRHGFMPIVVVAKTPEDYQKWLSEQKAQSAPKPSEG
jgi:cytochrome c oxidase subunit 2